ncbi:lipase family alpha/beta hydrolase [Modestobacter sp. VKM Ac-2978]|uniref:lipase family alpha/beta hydrolase n=1 Tax=Modestobacter sp. VKM Ac-2978 TaxID=3004132 RepID=UPI0022AB0948|nr:lipase [Modestobacter sp. VKM Ac-2978]MCZ2850365.1 lipase [Modestobacter sp. VKM Ac-2978]
MRRCWTVLVCAVVVLLAGQGTAAAAPVAGGYADLDQRGPALAVPAAQLAASLHCNGPVTKGGRAPVLLLPGTTMDPAVGFAWNYERAFDRLGWRWCAVTLPDDATGDIQVAAEHVVSAVRTVSKQAGQRVDVVGWSQGGMIGRWALRFWPDTRAMVDDLVGLSPSNHGTTVADLACQTTCTPANWQQRSISAFTAALNSGAETFDGVSYTVAYTRADEVVVPNAGPTASSVLRTGEGWISNIATQDVCPANAADHFAIGSYDPVGYAIAIDALTHDGPAVRARVPVSTCLQVFQPGVDPATFATDHAAFVAYATDGKGDAADVPAEPALQPYVFARR